MVDNTKMKTTEVETPIGVREIRNSEGRVVAYCRGELDVMAFARALLGLKQV